MKLFITLFLLVSFNTVAQPIKYKKDWASDITDNAYAPKRIYLNAFYCLPNLQANTWKYLESKADYNFTTKTFVGIKGDYAINKNWSAGVGYQFFNAKAIWAESYNDSVTGKLSFIDKKFSAVQHTFLLSQQWHVFSNYKFDVFVNGEVGLHIFSYVNSNTILAKPKLLYGMLGGGFRFFATKKLALQIIGGVSTTHNIQVGACYRLGL